MKFAGRKNFDRDVPFHLFYLQYNLYTIIRKRVRLRPDFCLLHTRPNKFSVGTNDGREYVTEHPSLLKIVMWSLLDERKTISNI